MSWNWGRSLRTLRTRFSFSSGSMLQGGKMEQARKALQYCVKTLRDGDRFNIVDFSTAARNFSGDGLVPFNTATKTKALKYIDKLTARGGTAISEALELSLKHLGRKSATNNRLKMITDWAKTRDEVIEVHLRASAPTALTERLEGGERLFDLLTDPTEQHNLIGAEGRAQQAADLRRHLRFHAQRLGELDSSLTGSAGEAQLSEEQIRQLKSLGYLGGVDR